MLDKIFQGAAPRRACQQKNSPEGVITSVFK